MSLFGNIGGALSGVLGQLQGGNKAGILDEALQKGGLGGLSGVVDKLRQSGFGKEVDSWLGGGSNLPISADQLRTALGNEEVQKIAAHFGIPVDRVSKMLEQYLPQAVDQASPDGQIDPDAVQAADKS
ncbi:MAG TPA: YidB family protein [Stellaceae bacterium]|nr:YidB family protein [Stellaceae bacterium]